MDTPVGPLETGALSDGQSVKVVDDGARMISPPRSKSPRRTSTGKHPREESVGEEVGRPHDSPVNPVALNKALRALGEPGRRNSSPSVASPSRKRQRMFGGGDRFIPNRAGQDLSASYNLLHEDASPATSKVSRNPPSDLHFQTRAANKTYSEILRSEMFDEEVPQSINAQTASRSRTPPFGGNSSARSGSNVAPSTPHKNMFNYGSSKSHALTPRSSSRGRGSILNPCSELYSLSPVKHSSQTMLLSPRKTPRAVSKVPYKVLDAPDLADDFYLNLVDWGSNDILAVGLGKSVYLWSRETGQVQRLCELDDETVTSVSWIQRGTHLAVGSSKGELYIYDTTNQRRLRTMHGHSLRISSLAWNAHILSTGSRDRTILHRDVRMSQMYLRKLTGHKQEVCGLKWNTDTEQLASGGNDNKIFVWEKMEERWLHRWGEQEGGHKAAVKAIAWSPHSRGLLASGGGTADRCIKFWNTISTAQTMKGHNGHSIPPEQLGVDLDFTRPSLSSLSSPSLLSNPTNNTTSSHNNPHLIKSHDTGSQVCNLLFSHKTSELVSTHGYSQHAINIWKYPGMTPVVSLTGHTYRVLYLAMSPDGSVIVTGAGDETLRFWDVFQNKGKNAGPGGAGKSRGGIVGEWGVIR